MLGGESPFDKSKKDYGLENKSNSYGPIISASIIYLLAEYTLYDNLVEDEQNENLQDNLNFINYTVDSIKKDVSFNDAVSYKMNEKVKI